MRNSQKQSLIIVLIVIKNASGDSSVVLLVKMEEDVLDSVNLHLPIFRRSIFDGRVREENHHRSFQGVEDDESVFVYIWEHLQRPSVDPVLHILVLVSDVVAVGVVTRSLHDYLFPVLTREPSVSLFLEEVFRDGLVDIQSKANVMPVR